MLLIEDILTMKDIIIVYKIKHKNYLDHLLNR